MGVQVLYGNNLLSIPWVRFRLRCWREREERETILLNKSVDALTQYPA